jgi:hypothetical protein
MVGMAKEAVARCVKGPDLLSAVKLQSGSKRLIMKTPCLRDLEDRSCTLRRYSYTAPDVFPAQAERVSQPPTSEDRTILQTLRARGY